MALVYNDRIIRGPAWCGDCDRPKNECWCDLPSEADEIAANIIKDIGGERPTSVAAAELLTTHYCGTPKEFGHQMHANVVEALLK